MVDVVEGYRDQQIYKRLKEDDRALTAEDEGGNPNGTVVPASVLPAPSKPVPIQKPTNPHPVYLTFPRDLDAIHYMQFRAVKFATSSRKAPSKKDICSITLPIPANLQNQYAADYEETGLGMAGALISDQMSVDDVKTGIGKAYTDIKGGISGLGKQFEKEAETEELFMDEPGGSAPTVAEKTSGSMNQALGLGMVGGVSLAGSATLGVLGTAVLGGDLIGGAVKGGFKKMGFVMNPHLASIFTGVGKKNHTFNFKFIAKNAGESSQIQNIINAFRENMLPSYEYGKFGLTYPNEWEINFSTETQKYLYKISTCVLKSFNATYNGGGVPVFHQQTNAPVEVDISLSFTETSIETRDDTTIDAMSTPYK